MFELAHTHCKIYIRMRILQDSRIAPSMLMQSAMRPNRQNGKLSAICAHSILYYIVGDEIRGFHPWSLLKTYLEYLVPTENKGLNLCAVNDREVNSSSWMRVSFLFGSLYDENFRCRINIFTCYIVVFKIRFTACLPINSVLVW